MLLPLLLGIKAMGQFNPTNPPEPNTPSPSPTTYAVTIDCMPEDGGTSSIKSSRYKVGDKINPKATPKSGFIFVGWENESGEILSTDATRFYYEIPERDSHLVARFKYNPSNPSEPTVPPQYAQVNVKMSPIEAGSVNGGGKYLVGSTVTISASYIGSDYIFKNFTVGGEVVSSAKSFQYVVKPSGNDIVANCTYNPSNPLEPAAPSEIKNYKFSSRTSPSEGGYVNISSGSYGEGEKISLSAYGYSSYKFTSWTDEQGEILSNSPTFQYTMPGKNVILTANFTFNPTNPGEPNATVNKRNLIYGSRRSVSPGTEMMYEILLENSDEITGINIDLQLPEGFFADYSRVQVGERASDHNISTQPVDNKTQRIFLSGNGPIVGGSGAILQIPVMVPPTAENGLSYTITLSRGVIFKANGEQEPVGTTDGIVKISDKEITLPDSPDFVVKSLTARKASVMPGDPIELSWIVANEGTIPSQGGWRETVWLVNGAGKRASVGTIYFDGADIPVGGNVSRSATLQIPEIPGIDGDVNVMVTLSPYASSGEIEQYQVNNVASTPDYPITLGKRLILEVPVSVYEGSDNIIRCRLLRSGDRGDGETFVIKKVEGDNRLSLPETVRIPKDQSGSYFQMTLDDNDELDDMTKVRLSVSGNGYEAVDANIEIVDNEYPDIELEFASDRITEGEKVMLHILLPRATPTPLTVNLSCDNAARFSFPANIEIPAGESSVEVEIVAIDNDLIESKADVSFFATATGYGKGEAWIDLNDNDMPVLELELSQNEVNEGAGSKAIRGVLRRVSNKDTQVTVIFNDDSPNTLIYNKKVTLEKGVDQIDFNIGIIDNAFHEEDKIVTLTASVFLQTCSCSASTESGGSVSKTITVIDNDGPSISLSLSNATLRKDARTTTATVSVNTKLKEPLTISLDADKSGLLEMPATVTIGAGSSSAEVNIVAPESSFKGSEEMISLSAQAKDFAKGTAVLLISDKTLPDATVKIGVVTTEDLLPGSEMPVEVLVSNEGNAPMPDATPVEIYLSGKAEPIALLHTSKVLAPGDKEEMEVRFRVPEIPNQYTLTAYVNEASGFVELTKTNNSSEPVVFNVKSPFIPSMEASREIIPFNQSVTLYGNASNYKKELEVYYLSQGIRESVKTTPDDNGRFSVDITPRFPGDYKAGVCIPGEGKKEEMASFSVMGLRLDNSNYLLYDMEAGSTLTHYFKITNPSSVALNGLKVEAVSPTPNCEVEITSVPTLGGNETAEIGVKVTAKGVTDGKDWETFNLKLSCNEGIESEKTIYFYGRPNKGRLISSVKSINTTMTVGESRVYKLTLGNNGSGATGDITLVLPSFMQSGTPSSLPSINPGEEQDVTIVLTPSSEMQLNVALHGTIGINCANGSGLSLPFTVEPVSDREGKLIVDARDEYTFYTAESPHLENADVMVTHPVTGKLIAGGKTNADGLWEMTLPEGYYALEVSAQKHGVYRKMILIDPGVDNFHPVFLPFEAISYSWNVEETTVDDEYEIVTTVEFETRVPKPVVVVEFPKLKYMNQVAYVSVTNKGLITATNIEVITPESNDIVQMEVVGDNKIAELLPGENKMIPLKVTVPQEGLYDDFTMTVNSYSFTSDYQGSGEEARKSNSSIRSNSGCVSVPCKVEVDDPECDPLTGEPIYGRKKLIEGNYRTGTCNPYSFPAGLGAPDFGNGGFGGGGGAPGGPGGGGGGSSNVSTYWQDRMRTFLMTGCASDCEKALADALKACADAAKGCLGLDLLPDAVNCGKGLFESCRPSQINDIHDSLSCGGSAAGCFPPLGCPAGIGECLNRAYKAFIECMKLYKHRKDTGSLARKNTESTTEDKTIEAKERRVKTVILYYEYYDLVRQNILNLLGEGNWSRLSNGDLGKMLSFVRDNCDSDGFVVAGEASLAGKPESIDIETYNNFIRRFNNTVRYEKNGDASEDMVDYAKMQSISERASEIEEEVKELGYPDLQRFAEEAATDIREYAKMAEEPSNGVCASITLRFSQTLVLARQAFRGTLSVTNGNEEVAMTDVKLQVKVRDSEGNLVGEREFAVAVEKLEGFTGEAEMGAPWKLAGNSTGDVSILFIPSKYAAPVNAQVYSFGGVLSYVDPFTGVVVSRELAPIEMTVAPTPLLDLDYFIQRDVIGDDPMTEDVVEDSEPAEFALLIRNKGYGEASNLRMVTRQPEIIENSRGLAIDFRITGSSMKGKEQTVVMGEKIPTEFGNLPASSTTYAQWWLTSSLLGHFKSYDVKATQVSAYGSEDMSLLDNVRIHELIHGFTIPVDGSTERAFLVNDIDDVEVLPDMIWFSDSGNDEIVNVLENATISDDTDTSCLLNVPAATGWNYGRLSVPWDGMRRVVGVERLSNHCILPADNVWCTSVTMRNSSEPKHEEVLHFVANMNGEAESFKLMLEEITPNKLKVIAIKGLPEENSISETPVEKVEIRFNKDVDLSTFGVEDLELSFNGEEIGQENLEISPAHIASPEVGVAEVPSEGAQGGCREFIINFKDMTSASGHYTLSVNTKGINDMEGFSGASVHSVGWSQLSDGKVRVNCIVVPAESGSTNIVDERVKYNSEITVKATPNEGYIFSKWEEDGVYMSSDASYKLCPKHDTQLVATFAQITHLVNIEYDPEMGYVEGAGSGLYSKGKELKVKAVSNPGYYFVHWTDENDKVVSESEEYAFRVDSDISLKAKFETGTTGLNEIATSANSYIYPTAVHDRIFVGGDFSTLISLYISDIKGAYQRQVYGSLKDSPINVSSLLPGIYIVRVETDLGVSVHKIIKL